MLGVMSRREFLSKVAKTTTISLPAGFWLHAHLLHTEALGQAIGEQLPNTELLEMQGDIARQLVEGVDAFLLQNLEQAAQNRHRSWHRDLASPVRYNESIRANREQLAKVIGLKDARPAQTTMEIVESVHSSGQVGQGANYKIYAVRWRAFRNVYGEGLLLVPESPPVADVIVLPDADHTPEQIAGLAPGVAAESQYARRLVESGCRVIIPVLINRTIKPYGTESHWSSTRLSNREYIYRPAYELGRHIIGYEVQKILAAIDWLESERENENASIGVMGWGEGGLLALYASALDTRIAAACVSGYFDAREDIWQEPIYRNVFGLLEQFGDAEIASMIAPRSLIIEAAQGPEIVIPPGTGGAPGKITTPAVKTVRAEVKRAESLVEGLTPKRWINLVVSGKGQGPYGSAAALRALIASLNEQATLVPSGDPPEILSKTIDPKVRHQRQLEELDRHTQYVLSESANVRNDFFSKVDTKSSEDFASSIQWYNDYFYKEVVGRFTQETLPPHARTRLLYDEQFYRGYQVVLDVFPGVFAYGILLLPKGMHKNEKRPVVVCQHGLEGRPRDTVMKRDYHSSFAARLAEDGFITFSPQNLYIFGDDFRTLQRKANPLGKTLFSIIIPQHQQIVDWLQTLPQVDSERIGLYGISYGGKTVMRVTPVVEDYKVAICSADFNDWVWKNASTRSPYSYVWSGEYEIFEWDLGSTFNYAEMATLIAPRPFMVERGHFDGVAPDERVAYEYAKVRFLYEAKLGIGERTEIAWFVGPHQIHGEKSFDFLHKWLDFPEGWPK